MPAEAEKKPCKPYLICFNQFGDMERAFLRNGNVHSADEWQSVLEPIISRYRSYDIPRFFRGDAGFADPVIVFEQQIINLP